MQGTGKLNNGKYIHTLNGNTLFPPDFSLHAVYEYLDQSPSACGTFLEKESTIAVSADALLKGEYHCGDEYYIDIQRYEGKIFTITDTGSFTEGDSRHFDISVGEQACDNFYTKYRNTGTKYKVAKVLR